MLTIDQITEIFFLADDYCIFFDDFVRKNIKRLSG